MDDYKIILPYASTPNPVPKIFAGGDCGACVLSGITGKSVQDIYDHKGKVEPIHYYEMKKFLNDFGYEFDNQLPAEDGAYHEILMQFGKLGYRNSINWYERVESFIRRGWVGIVQISHDGRGNDNHESDHWALLVGIEQTTTQNKAMAHAKDINRYVWISCSMNGGSVYSKEVNDFLKHYGGYNCYFVNVNK